MLYCGEPLRCALFSGPLEGTMSYHNKYLNTLFIVEFIVGLTTVANLNLDRKPWRRICSVLNLVIIILGVFNIDYFMENLHRNYVFYVHESTSRIIAAYAIVLGMVNYKTKLTAVLNIAEIDNQLLTGNFRQTNSTYSLIVSLISLLFYVAHFGESIYHTYVGEFKRRPFKYVNNVLFNGIKCCLLFGCVVSLAELSRVQQNINQEFEKLQSTEGRVLKNYPRQNQRRFAWKDMTDARLKFLKEVQGCLFHVEENVRCYHWIFLTWFAVVAAVLTPSIALEIHGRSLIDVLNYDFTISRYTAFIFIIILSYANFQRKKESAVETIGALFLGHLQDEDIACTKHQLLALHYRRTAFDCLLFDVDSSLFVDILDTSILVISVLLSK